MRVISLAFSKVPIKKRLIYVFHLSSNLQQCFQVRLNHRRRKGVFKKKRCKASMKNAISLGNNLRIQADSLVPFPGILLASTDPSSHHRSLCLLCFYLGKKILHMKLTTLTLIKTFGARNPAGIRSR